MQRKRKKNINFTSQNHEKNTNLSELMFSIVSADQFVIHLFNQKGIENKDYMPLYYIDTPDVFYFCFQFNSLVATTTFIIVLFWEERRGLLLFVGFRSFLMFFFFFFFFRFFSFCFCFLFFMVVVCFIFFLFFSFILC